MFIGMSSILLKDETFKTLFLKILSATLLLLLFAFIPFIICFFLVNLQLDKLWLKLCAVGCGRVATVSEF